MIDSPSELIVAARHLAQWGRTRQTVWQDASRDLLAALGNRYASFDDLQSAPPPPPPPLPRPQTVRPPQFAPVPEPMPVFAAPPPPPVLPPPPVVQVTPVATPVKTTPRAVSNAPRPSRARIRPAVLVLAAVAVIAVLATPALWKVYEASRVVVPATNTLTIESTPPGSIVVIDGVESGKTPLSTSLMLGLHHIEVRYRKNVRTLDVEVVAGEPLVRRIDWVRRSAPGKRPAPKIATGGAGTAAKRSASSATAAADRGDAPANEASTATAAESLVDSDTASSDVTPAEPAEPATPPAAPRP